MTGLIWPRTKFTQDDFHKANDEWGANCGPGALAAILQKTLDEVRPALKDFDKKHYTNPSMMFGALMAMDIKFKSEKNPLAWPDYGLARIQWHGPWMKEGVPIKARYRHTHWVGALSGEFQEKQVTQVFDINCMCVGGWVPLAEWSGQVVPWLLKECESKSDGTWSITHGIEILRDETQ